MSVTKKQTRNIFVFGGSADASVSTSFTPILVVSKRKIQTSGTEPSRTQHRGWEVVVCELGTGETNE